MSQVVRSVEPVLSPVLALLAERPECTPPAALPFEEMAARLLTPCCRMRFTMESSRGSVAMRPAPASPAPPSKAKAVLDLRQGGVARGRAGGLQMVRLGQGDAFSCHITCWEGGLMQSYALACGLASPVQRKPISRPRPGFCPTSDFQEAARQLGQESLVCMLALFSSAHHLPWLLPALAATACTAALLPRASRRELGDRGLLLRGLLHILPSRDALAPQEPPGRRRQHCCNGAGGRAGRIGSRLGSHPQAGRPLSKRSWAIGFCSPWQ